MAGNTRIVDDALALGPIYMDATYKYFGEAYPGAILAGAVWRVSRMSMATSQIDWADGNGKFDNVFTDLSTVAALTFA